MKNLKLSLLAILFVFSLYSCNETQTGINDKTDDISIIENGKGGSILAAPIIQSISPSSALRNTMITVTGKNFGATQKKSVLTINGVNTQIIEWKKTSIRTWVTWNVPSGIAKVAVIVDGVKSNDFDLTVLKNSQVWMEGNLDVSTYRNGDPIPEVSDPTEWLNLRTGAWCYYDNDPLLGQIYGKLYNWYAINDPRGIAPEGYHIPELFYDWTNLAYNWGNQDVSGGYLKAISSYWTEPNVGANNESGFTALPGGYRTMYGGEFIGLGAHACFWSGGTAYYNGEDTWAYIMILKNDNPECTFSIVPKYTGRSVRCIHD
ncbi:MAG: FISUMP domain-containing protein [bacterium]